MEPNLEQNVPIVSIIIPSHNKYPLNYMTLCSIEKQDIELDRIEVIFIDDGSTDDTRKLDDIQWAFPFKYIRCNVNVGRARARNIGASYARGEVFLFLDAEMLVPRQFVNYHLSHHLQ